MVRPALNQSTRFLLEQDGTFSNIQKSPSLIGDLRVFCTEEINQISIGLLMVHAVATGLKGYCSEIVFRPCMDSEV